MFGECGDVGASDNGEADDNEESGGCNAGGRVFLPEQAEGHEREDAEESEEEGKRFGEVGETEGDAHERGIAELCGGEMTEQSCEGEEEKCLKEGIGPDFAHAEFALGGDDEEADAEVAEGVTVQQEGCWVW